MQVLANYISVTRLEELCSQQFKSDFPRCKQDERLEMSEEDHQFLDIASQSARLVEGHYSITLPLRNKDIKMPNNCKVADLSML